jgi:MoaA/NifB/PqqE/SkfB family radical SAM enzyme
MLEQNGQELTVAIQEKPETENSLKKLLQEFKTNLAYHFSEAMEEPYVKPHWVYISLSHKCTYQCRMCEVVKILNGHELELAAVKNALDEISAWGTDCVVTFTGGEPFLRNDIFEIFSYALSKNVQAEVVSNGSCIDRTLAEKIISSGIRNIAVSLDGACDATHDFIRQKGSFQKAINALKYLSEAKKRKGLWPQISVWTTIMKENVEQLYDFIPLVKGLGVDCLVYHPVIVAQDDMQNTSQSAQFWIKDEVALQELKNQIGKIKEYQSKNGLVAFLHEPYLWLDYFKGTLSRQQWKCNPFVFINIGPDGQLRSCGAAFGDVKKSGINGCLETEDAYRARKQMKQCPKPCLQTCWGHPESDSIKQFTNDFILKVSNIAQTDEEKEQVIQKALLELKRYEDAMRAKHAKSE